MFSLELERQEERVRRNGDRSGTVNVVCSGGALGIDILYCGGIGMKKNREGDWKESVCMCACV